MAERQMTPKGFLAKLSTKAANSAAGFILAHRQWLTTGELASVTSPILAKLDTKELLPTPALKELGQAVMNHIIVQDQRRAEASMEGAQQSGTTKPWVATIYDSKGLICTKLNSDGEEEELVKGFDHPQEADRWVDRRLYDGASDWHGEVDGLG